MFGRKNKEAAWPATVVTSLADLMRFEFLVQQGNLLPSHPVYSILAGRHASKLRGRGLDFEEVRHYVPGDDIRNIDWRVTARTGETHSKVFNEEKERPSFLVVDQSSWMFFGSQQFVKSVSAAHAAAIAAFHTIRRGDRVGGIVFNEEGMDQVAPRRSRSLVQHFLQCVVDRNRQLPLRKELKSTPAHLNEALRRTLASITHDYVVSVIGDFSNAGDETKQLLRQISYHNDVILIHIYDPLDEALPDGKLVLTDGKRQILWNNKKKHWGTGYSKSFAELRTRLSDEFRHARIPIVFFHTGEAMEDQVMHEMGKFMKR